MYINRIILKNVRSIDNLDITFRNDWTGKHLESALIVGPNGSGKTTLLRVIVELWSALFNSTDLDIFFPPFERNIFENCNLAAIEVRDLAEKTVWIYYVSQPIYLFDLQEQIAPDDILIGGDFKDSSPKDKVNREWFSEIKNQAAKLQVGSKDVIYQLPNIIFLAAENRDIASSRETPSKDSYNEPLYKWLVTYDVSDRSNPDLETTMRNMKLRNFNEFQNVINQVNAFYTGKKLLDFDHNIRLMVEIEKKQIPGFSTLPLPRHHIDELSAGERQCLIQMVMVSRWLREGGVVLIDEPDLHLHVGLQRHFIHEMEKLVISRGGQLIVTSHSPTLWEEYSSRQRISLGTQQTINEA